MSQYLSMNTVSWFHSNFINLISKMSLQLPAILQLCLCFHFTLCCFRHFQIFSFILVGFQFFVAPCGRFPSCCTEDMCRLPVASLFICLWLAERSHCNGSLQNSMEELHTRFAVSLYQMLTETENNSNLIVSPLSVSTSLGLLQLGARGNTLAQLEGTLGYNVNSGFHRRFFGVELEKKGLYSGSIKCYSCGWRGCWWPPVLLVPGGVECCCCYWPCRAQWCLEP